MRLRRDPDTDLTEEELAVLRSSRSAPEVREFLSRSADQVGLKISGYQKLAAAARFEREAILEIRLLDAVKSTPSDRDALREQVRALQQANEELAASNRSLLDRITNQMALPAAVVHAHD